MMDTALDCGYAGTFDPLSRNNCGFFLHGNQTYDIVIAGGKICHSNIYNQSKILVASSGIWMDGPELSEHISKYASSVQVKGTMIIIGGYRRLEYVDAFPLDTFFALTHNQNTYEWTTLNVRLQEPKFALTAFLVPDYLVNC